MKYFWCFWLLKSTIRQVREKGIGNNTLLKWGGGTEVLTLIRCKRESGGSEVMGLGTPNYEVGRFRVYSIAGNLEVYVSLES